jgi:two-component system chemotaxis response regulator CheB
MRPLVATQIVAIAASTGGPAALQCLLAALPGDYHPPVLVVQHIARGFASGLAEWLDSVCDLRVKMAEPGEPLLPHTVYVAPDDRHLGITPPLTLPSPSGGEGRVRGATVALSASPPVGGFRPAGTYLFESVARVYGPAATAIVLTGMGEDGLVGLRAVRAAGGRIFAQDEKSCVVFGMPGVAVAEGLPDLVLPPEEIATYLINGS